jgi:hypothetical protein
MATQIDSDVRIVLDALAKVPRDHALSGANLLSATGLDADRVNDAAALLVSSSNAEWTQTFGTAPFDFADISLTARGRYEQQRAEAAEPARAEPAVSVAQTSPLNATSLAPVPIGSPFGFTDLDWEFVSRRRAEVDRLYVVLGHQFESTLYGSESLRDNVRKMFEQTVAQYNGRRRLGGPIKLKFAALGAGYGEHLFNQIARDIISSDIAVFETSELNPNVMLEFGVALTWGVRVLPIKLKTCPKPPSDVSGQTWADHEDSASVFTDPDHQNKLLSMVERAVQKKAAAAV